MSVIVGHRRALADRHLTKIAPYGLQLLNSTSDRCCGSYAADHSEAHKAQLVSRRYQPPLHDSAQTLPQQIAKIPRTAPDLVPTPVDTHRKSASPAPAKNQRSARDPRLCLLHTITSPSMNIATSNRAPASNRLVASQRSNLHREPPLPTGTQRVSTQPHSAE